MLKRMAARHAGWFLLEFACLLIPCLALYRLSDLILGQETGSEGARVSVVVSLYFTIAMRTKGVSL